MFKINTDQMAGDFLKIIRLNKGRIHRAEITQQIISFPDICLHLCQSAYFEKKNVFVNN